MSIILCLELLLWLAAGPLQDFQARLNEGGVFTARLEITDKSPDQPRPTVYQARLWLAADGYRLETDGKTYVVNGEESRVLEHETRRLIISAYDPADDDFAPARYLAGTPDGYKLKEQKTERGTRLTFKAAEEGATFTAVEVLFTSGTQPARLTASDAFGGTVTVNFTGASWTTAPDWKKLVLPEGVETVDLRQ